MHQSNEHGQRAEGARSGRNIVVFCDGTWNSPDEEEFGLPTSTNVYKLYRASLDEAESGGRQLTWYQPGVGSVGGMLRRALEGATGTGLGANIRRAYSAIAAHYRDGDRIFLVGFSRGAFTARSVAGMIQKVGLARSPDRGTVRKAFEAYRNAAHETESTVEGLRSGHDMRSDVRVHAIGIWDTVGALGFPLWGWSFNIRALWRNSFHLTSPNLITDHVFHALAIDEKRTSFMPVPWRDLPPGAKIPSGFDPHRRPVVLEAWFRGVHSDVGGGYGDCRLSDVALEWMAEQLKACGLLLRPGAPAGKPDHNGRVHNSARGPLWSSVATWPRWPATRTQDEGASPRWHLHESVARRERDLARSGVTDRGRRFLKPGESASVAIRADRAWEYTGVVMAKGQRYRLSARGYWQDLHDTPVGPDGQAPTTESLAKRMTRWARRLPQANWMSLVAVANHDYGWRWRELGLWEAARYFVFEDPAEFRRLQILVGNEADITAPADAELWAFANDLWKFYDNNTGSICLEVRREA